MSIFFPSQNTVPKRWVVESLAQIRRHQDPLARLQVMLDGILNLENGKTLTATDATTEHLEVLFGISFDVQRMGLQPWKLQSEPFEMPQRLKGNLRDLTRVLYGDAAEASCRIAVDMMLIACKLHVIELYPAHFSPKKRKVASRPDTPQDSEVREKVRIYPEVELAVEVVHPITRETVRVTGRADWAFGYSGWDGAAHGIFLVAMEAKRRDLFGTAERQLLTYLAILRQLRINAGKTNIVTQGFYTDGYRYCFMAITADGEIESSRLYDVMKPEDGKTIFNFIVTILESAIKSSPTITPIAASEQEDKEIDLFPGEVWSRVYVPYSSSPQIESDAEDEEFTDMTGVGLGD